MLYTSCSLFAKSLVRFSLTIVVRTSFSFSIDLTTFPFHSTQQSESASMSRFVTMASAILDIA